MAVYKIFADKDATIYSYYSAKNSGLDEILEISVYDNAIDNRGEVARSLIKFPTADITNIITNKVSGSNYSASLKLYLADASNIPLDFTLFCYPVSGTWNMGTGRAANLPTSSNGASWKYAKHNETIAEWTTSSFSSGVTASYASYAKGGSTWYTGSYEATQSFDFHSNKDIKINVTNVVKAWYTGSLANEGFVIKHSSSLEFQNSTVFELKYFSAETHTIYTPVLEVKWDDFIYSTGSGSPVTTEDVVATIRIGGGEVHEDSIKKVRVYARDRFPIRTFTTSSLYASNKYLPTASYWALKDLDSEEFIVDFDTEFTKISARYYFKLFHCICRWINARKMV
jgi:hypothetical protein